MKETLRLIIVLTAICLLSGLLLATISRITADPIRRAQEAKKQEALAKVLPAADAPPEVLALKHPRTGDTNIFYITDGGRGIALEAVSPNGYGGDIKLMVGFTGDGKLNGIDVLSQKETPGLGAKVDTEAFTRQFRGLSLADTKWAVDKDGGDIDGITAATISSRAVVDAIQKAIDLMGAHATITKLPEAQP